MLRGYSASIQELLLVVAGEPYGMTEIEPESAVCKANLPNTTALA